MSTSALPLYSAHSNKLWLPVLYSTENDVKRPLPALRNAQSRCISNHLHLSSPSLFPLLYLHVKFRYDPAVISWCANFFVRPGLTEETSFSRSADSLGFVLGEESDEDLPSHERLGDFRKRIWKRTRRRLSRRRSSSSYAGSSSDMDDILEDPEPCPLPFPLRPASSEPSLHVASPLALSPQRSPLSEAAEAVLVQMSGKRMMVTSSNGHLKAYSYDGVSPNLPVPFRARFRQRAPEESPSIEAPSTEVKPYDRRDRMPFQAVVSNP
ncbi:uncharacterized protein TNCV_4274201 [Trichonephila clavipes]|nr:uncharacterized protein TNCV_4274201 [Trichonephila clavipes]